MLSFLIHNCFKEYVCSWQLCNLSGLQLLRSPICFFAVNGRMKTFRNWGGSFIYRQFGETWMWKVRRKGSLCCCLVAKSCPTLLPPHGQQPTRLLCLWVSQARILEWVAISYPGDLPDSGIKLESPAWAGRFFTIKSPGKTSLFVASEYP